MLITDYLLKFKGNGKMYIQKCFLKLHSNFDNSIILVNTETICYIFNKDTTHTVISFINGKEITVKETLEEIKNLLSNIYSIYSNNYNP